MRKTEIMWVVGLITLVVSVFMLIAVACADEPGLEKGVIYTKEYVAQYLGEVITVTFINDNEEFNVITFVMEELIAQKDINLTRIKSMADIDKLYITNYYIVGKSKVLREVKININTIRTIQK